MTNYTQGPATCKHPSIVAWTLAEGDDAGEPAGLWSCRDCGHKFYPWTAVEEAVRAEVKGLQDKLEACEKAALDVYWNYHPDYFAKLPLCVQVVWKAGEDVAKKCGEARKP